jgi:hypothetical protein
MRNSAQKLRIVPTSLDEAKKALPHCRTGEREMTQQSKRPKCSHGRLHLQVVRFIFAHSNADGDGVFIVTLRCSKCKREFDGELA